MYHPNPDDLFILETTTRARLALAFAITLLTAVAARAAAKKVELA